MTVTGPDPSRRVTLPHGRTLVIGPMAMGDIAGLESLLRRL